MKQEKSNINGWEIIQSIQIGVQTIVLGKSTNKSGHLTFMTALYHPDDFMDPFEEIFISDNYYQAAKSLGIRIAVQSDIANTKPASTHTEYETIPAEHCTPLYGNECLADTVIVIKPESLNVNSRHAEYQLYVCIGCADDQDYSQGHTCLFREIYSGDEFTWNRQDIQGYIKPEYLRYWEKKREDRIAAKRLYRVYTTHPVLEL